jgi:hypothetical protein
MRQPLIINLVNTRISKTVVDWSESYQPKPDGKWPWAQKILFALLTRLGCRKDLANETVKVERVIIDRDDLMDRILTCHDNMIDHFDMEPDVLLIGPETLEELMNQPRIDQILCFDLEYRSGMKVMDLVVVVIPWMKGILPIKRNLL